MLKSARTAAFCLLLCSPAAVAQDAGHPTLWDVSDENTRLVLFGLPSLMDEDTDWQTADLDNTLAEARGVIFEADRFSAEAQATMQSIIPETGIFRDGRTLSGVAGTEMATQIERVSSQFGASSAQLDPLKPWLAAFQLQQLHVQAIGLMAGRLPSQVIAARAAETGAELRFLEEPAALIQTLSSMPEETHLALLSNALDDIETDPGQPQRVLDAWASGDINTLADLYHGGDAWPDPRLRQAMFVDRNAVWLTELRAILENESGVWFVAVGAGHLVGPGNLIDALGDSGYTVIRR